MMKSLNFLIEHDPNANRILVRNGDTMRIKHMGQKKLLDEVLSAERPIDLCTMGPVIPMLMQP